VLEQPLGQAALWLIVLGLIGYALWRFIEAWIDPYNLGTKTKGIITRIGIAGSGLFYGALAFSAIRQILGHQDDEDPEQLLTAEVLQLEGGAWLVGLAGLITIGVGLAQFYIAYTEEYNGRLHTDKLPRTAQRMISFTGRLGYSARGAVILLLSFFVMRAAIFSDPEEVQDTEGVL
jgi:hypothetical protein